MKILSTLSTKFRGRSDDTLREEIQGLRDELRAFRREHNGRLVEERHAVVDRQLEEAKFITGARLSEGASDPTTLAHRAADWLAVRDQRVIDELHAAVDRAPGLSDLSLSDYEAKVAAFEDEIRARDLELQRRVAAAQLEEAKRGLDAVAERAEA